MNLFSQSLVDLAHFPLWVYLSVLARLTPVVVLLLPLRSSIVPVRVRTFLSLGLALLLTPSAMSSAAPLPNSGIQACLALSGEALLGLLLGSLLMLFLLSLQISGQIVGQLAGINTTSGLEAEEPPIVAQLLGWLASLLWLVCGGHRYFVQGFLHSFTSYPIGSIQFQAAWFIELERALQHTFVIGLRVATPLALALLLANIITALVARTMPQLNVLAVGFNLNALVLMTLLLVSLGGVGWIFQADLSLWIQDYQRLLTTGS